MTALSSEVDEKLKVYKSLQSDIQTLFSQKTTTLSQYNENTLVSGELDLLDEDTPVYKLVGPILMTIELKEAKDNVKMRLDLIQSEVEKVETAIDAKRKEHVDIGNEIAEIQQRMQAEAAAAARKIADTANP